MVPNSSRVGHIGHLVANGGTGRTSEPGHAPDLDGWRCVRTRTRDERSRPSVVLFDFDGVIRHWRVDVTDALDRGMGLEAGTFARLAHAVPEHDLGVLGKVTFDDWCRAVTLEVEAVAPPGMAAGAVEQWRRYRGDIDDRMVTTGSEERCARANTCGRTAVSNRLSRSAPQASS
jgi:hypothetical protein